MCCVLFYLIFNLAWTLVISYRGSAFPNQHCPPGSPYCTVYTSASPHHSFHGNHNPEGNTLGYRSMAYKHSPSFHHNPHYHHNFHFRHRLNFHHKPFIHHSSHNNRPHTSHYSHHFHNSQHLHRRPMFDRSPNFQHHRHPCFQHSHNFNPTDSPPFTITTTVPSSFTFTVPTTTTNRPQDKTSTTSQPIITTTPAKYIPALTTTKQEIPESPTNRSDALLTTTENIKVLRSLNYSTTTEYFGRTKESTTARTTTMKSIFQSVNISEPSTYPTTTTPISTRTNNSVTHEERPTTEKNTDLLSTTTETELNLQLTTTVASQKIHNVTNSTEAVFQLDTSSTASVNEKETEEKKSVRMESSTSATQSKATEVEENATKTKFLTTTPTEIDNEPLTTEAPTNNSFFDELYCDVKNLEDKAEFFSNNKTYHIYSDSYYTANIPLEGFDESSFEIEVQHRVLSIAAWNVGKTEDYFEIIILPTVADTKQALWSYDDNILEIYFSFKHDINVESCGEIDESVIRLNREFNPITY